MSALNILGGVGQGLMRGSEAIGQMRQREAYNDYLKVHAEGMRANQERARWEHDRKMEAAGKLDQYNRLAQNIEAQYADRSVEEREAMKLQQASQLGLLRSWTRPVPSSRRSRAAGTSLRPCGGWSMGPDPRP